MSSIEGVAGVEVDFGDKTAFVTMQAGRTLTRSQCETAFSDTRYKVLRFEAKSGTPSAGPGT
ncbi:MAG: hypothetical protein E4H03_08225 [Myxococcales bacterium]|nr:MAG: hypothetical protein E4H03_08225 [Myxococcales bacterium]